MFDLFRSRDKAVRIMLGGLLLLVAFSMLTYLIPGGPTMGSGGGTDTVVAEIGKDAISTTDVQQIIQLNTRGQRLPAELMAHYVPQYVNSMITEHALAYEAARLGYKVSDDDLAKAIRQTIPQLFPNGKFAGKDAYAQVLAQQNLTIPQFEEDLSRQLLITKMRNVALEGTIVTPQEIEQEYHRRSDKIKIEYVKIPVDKLRATVQVTPAELQKYYDEHKPLYQVPEKRDLGIVLIDQAKLEQTIQPTEADLLRVYNENKDHYRTPEHVDVRHILLKTDEKDPKSDTTVKAKAEGLVKQLRGGANFAEMAKKYSEDPSSAAKGGEVDGVERGQMFAEFEKAAFSLKPGEISDPVKVTYGYHILLVLKHEQAQLRPFDGVKTEIAGEYKKQRVNELMQQTADKAQAALTKDPQHPEKVAADLNLQYIKADQVGPGSSIPEIGTNKDFDESIGTLKVGEVSQQVLLPGNKIAMAVVTGDTPAHPAAMAEVETKVHDGLVKDKTDKLIAAKGAELADKARANGGDLAAAAKAMGFEMKTSADVDRAGAIEGLGSAGVLLDAFVKPVGTIVGPVGIGDSKVVCKVVEKVPADASGLEAQRVSIRDQIKGQKSQTRNSLFEDGVREALTKEGKIKIHEDVMNRLIASYHS
jgi:peptidyl-prolyl cis-trans isomerase D